MILAPRWPGKRRLYIEALASCLKAGHTLIYYPKDGYWIIKHKEKER